MLWDHQISLFSGVGYKDNVLLSPFNPRESPFAIEGLDLSVLRLPLDGWEVVGVITGYDIEYWRNIGANSEDSLLASLRLERELPSGWRVAVEGRGLDEKEVLDITTRRGSPATALVQGYGITGEPSARKDFADGLFAQAALPITHWSLQAPLDDYWDWGPVATLGYNITKTSDIAASYGASYQQHAEWLALDSFGRPLPRHLQIFQDRTELAWHQYWDRRRHLHSATRLVFAWDQDNGGGYFNFYQYQIVEDALWQTADWQIKGSVQQVYELYPVQGVGILNGQTLDRNFLNMSLAVERRVWKGLKAFGRAQYQHGHSNYAENAGDYAARTYSCGLRWEF